MVGWIDRISRYSNVPIAAETAASRQFVVAEPFSAKVPDSHAVPKMEERVEDAPDVMAGSHVDALDLRHPADQRQAILRHRAETGLACDDPLGAETSARIFCARRECCD
jgi:hypothetical protein